MDVDVEVLVHGGEGGAVFELLGGQPAVHHVVMKSVQQLDVHVAHQGVQDLLQHDHNTESVCHYTSLSGENSFALTVKCSSWCSGGLMVLFLVDLVYC